MVPTKGEGQVGAVSIPQHFFLIVAYYLIRLLIQKVITFFFYTIVCHCKTAFLKKKKL